MCKNLTLAILLSLLCCAITQAQEPPPVAPSPIPALDAISIIYQGKLITIDAEALMELSPKERTRTVAVMALLRAAAPQKLSAPLFEAVCELLPGKLLKEGVKREK